jgi:hypothetical protein
MRTAVATRAKTDAGRRTVSETFGRLHPVNVLLPRDLEALGSAATVLAADGLLWRSADVSDDDNYRTPAVWSATRAMMRTSSHSN